VKVTRALWKLRNAFHVVVDADIASNRGRLRDVDVLRHSAADSVPTLSHRVKWTALTGRRPRLKSPTPFLPCEDNMKASEAELQQEIDEIKKGVSSLEKAFDSVLAKDDLQAMEEGRQDLAGGRTAVPPASQEEALLKYEVRLSRRADWSSPRLSSPRGRESSKG
jgi:CHAD domain-containing protein